MLLEKKFAKDNIKINNVTFPHSKISIWNLFIIEKERQSYILGASLDSYLFVYIYSNNSIDLMGHVKTGIYPVCKYYYDSVKNILYCGGVEGSIYIYENFTQDCLKNQFSINTTDPAITKFSLCIFKEQQNIFLTSFNKQIYKISKKNDRYEKEFIYKMNEQILLCLAAPKKETSLLILILDDKKSPLVLSSILNYKQSLNQRNKQSQELDTENQVTQIDYSMTLNKVVTGNIAGQVSVYNIEKKNNFYICQLQWKIKVSNSRVNEIKVKNDILAYLIQNKAVFLNLKEKKQISRISFNKEQKKQKNLFEWLNNQYELIMAQKYDALRENQQDIKICKFNYLTYKPS